MYLYSQNEYFLLRKPRGIASTYGQEKCVLDYFKQQWELENLYIEKPDIQILSVYVDVKQYKEEDISVFLNNQTSLFSQKQEYGLLNRLDNDTGWFLYFAKTPWAFAHYKALQKQWKVTKQYIAIVEWNPFYKSNQQILDIRYPIMHLASNPEKMIVVKGFQDANKWRWKPHKGITKISLLEYFPDQQKSVVSIEIQKGIRHQIRAHLASIGSAILWDILYNKKTKHPDLQLRSVGFLFDIPYQD